MTLSEEVLNRKVWDRILKNYPCQEEDVLKGGKMRPKDFLCPEMDRDFRACCWFCRTLDECVPRWEEYLANQRDKLDKTVCPIFKRHRWCSACLDKLRKRNAFRER